MSGQSDMTIGGGVESMSRVGMGASGGAWAVDPQIAIKSYFTPQGIGADLIATLDGFSRDDVDAYAVESQKRAANAWKNGYFKKSVVPVKDILGQTMLDRDEHMRPDATHAVARLAQPAFAQLGEFAGFDSVAQQRYPQVEKLNHVHHAGNSSGIVDGAAAVLLGTKEAGKSRA
jgi:acetyl-CoA C-acetyltransferase